MELHKSYIVLGLVLALALFFALAANAQTTAANNLQHQSTLAPTSFVTGAVRQ